MQGHNWDFESVGAAIVQERPLFKKYFFNPNFAAIIRERPLFESDRFWHGYGKCLSFKVLSLLDYESFVITIYFHAYL